MDYESLLKSAWNFQKDNIVTYVIATIIAFVGMILIVTIAPLLYGLAYMGVKGSRNEPVEISDILEGFRNGNLIRSWVYWIIPFVIIFGIFIMGIILVGIVSGISSTLAVLLGLLVNIVVIVAGLLIGIAFLLGLPLLVTNESSGGVDIAKESYELLKANPRESIEIYIIMLLLNIIGSIPFVVLITAPLAFIFLANAIRELTGIAIKS